MMRVWEAETKRSNLSTAEVLHRDATYGSVCVLPSTVPPAVKGRS